MELARFEVIWRLNAAQWRVLVGQNCAYWRHQRGRKQTDVAQALGVSQATISRLERARIDEIPFRRLVMLATYLGVHLSDLVWTGEALAPRI